jgi:hypothetical protein
MTKHNLISSYYSASPSDETKLISHRSQSSRMGSGSSVQSCSEHRWLLLISNRVPRGTEIEVGHCCSFRGLDQMFLTYFDYKGRVKETKRWPFSDFTSDSLVFPSPVHKLPDQNIQDSNLTFCFVWVWNLDSHTKRRIQIEGVWKQGAEENI